MADHELKKGTVIYSVGDPADCMYHIVWGKVSLHSRDPKTGRRQVSECFVGDTFGARGLIDHEPRTDTAIVAEKGTMIERIDEAGFGRFLANNPSKVYALFQQLSRELREVTSDYLDVCRSVADAMGPAAEAAGAVGDYSLAQDADLRTIHDRHADNAENA